MKASGGNKRERRLRVSYMEFLRAGSEHEQKEVEELC